MSLTQTMSHPDADALDAAARRLRDAYAGGAIEPLRGVLEPTDAAGAYAVQSINTRFWLGEGRKISGRKIGFENLDLATEYDRLVDLIDDIKPDAIVHFAEQRAAPYSMRTEKTKRYTVDNNVRATHNLLTALVTWLAASLALRGSVSAGQLVAVYGYASVNVEAQSRDPNSLLSWTKRMLAVRKTSQAFGRGTRRLLKPDGASIRSLYMPTKADSFHWVG